LRLRRGDDGPAVFPLDLGFLNPLWRPPLFQLLANLGPACNFGLQIPETPQDNWETVPETVPETARETAPAAAAGEADDGAAEAAEPRVLYRPRIVLDGRLVVARRRWKVPPELYPSREAAESDADHFLRTDRWRRSHGIPREVFVSLYPTPGAAPPPAPAAGEERRRLRGHIHKPQYVDFANPLLVDLFGRLVEDDDPRHFSILLYERLPGRQHLAAAGDGHYVTELVLQVDLPGGLTIDNAAGDGEAGAIAAGDGAAGDGAAGEGGAGAVEADAVAVGDAA
jgi:hypothetical protein